MLSALTHLFKHLRGVGLGAILIRGTLSVGAIRIANKAITLVAAVVLARILGAQGYGFYAYAMAVVTTIAIPAQIGLPQLVTREIAAAEARREYSLMRGMRRRALQLASVSVVLGSLVGCAILLVSVHIPAINPAVFALAMLLLPLQIGLALLASMLRGLRFVVQSTWPQIALQPLLFLLLIFISMRYLTAWNAMALNLIATAVALVVLVKIFQKHWPEDANRFAPTYHTRAWLMSLLPFTMMAGINLINKKTDILMLGFFSSASDVGVYTVVFQGAMLVSLPLTAVNAVLAPNIARLYTQGDHQRLQRLITVATLATSLVAGIAGLGLILVGRWLLASVFGNDFADGYPVLAILCIGQLMNTLAGSVSMFLNMTGHEKDALKGATVSAMLNVILNALLIPYFGMVGAAIATAISLMIWNILLGILVFKRLRLVAGPFGARIKATSESK
ncbi:flippase [Hoeflea sp. CAU 1731]